MQLMVMLVVPVVGGVVLVPHLPTWNQYVVPATALTAKSCGSASAQATWVSELQSAPVYTAYTLS